MKPSGPIPPGFTARDGKLAIGGQAFDALVSKAGATPLFVYSAAMLSDRVSELRAAMPACLAIHYAIKANPFAPLLHHMAGLVDGFDIASAGELSAAVEAGMDPARISFAGPGKRDRELEAAIRAGVTVNLESAGELRRLQAVADRLGIAPRAAIRVNPDFELKGSGMKMGGSAKPFGVDADEVARLIRQVLGAGLEWRGLHIFAGSQSLDTAGIIEAQALTLALAARLADAAGLALPACNLGGGFGIPYFAGDRPVEIGAIGEALGNALFRRPAALVDTDFAIELGRWLVGEAGVYLTRIIDRKVSRGHTFLVTDGGLHHQLAASGNFGTVIRRNYPVAIADRFEEPGTEAVSVVGCLCTPLDRLADDVLLPVAREGEVVALFCAGAYGASASPAAFLGHGPALELLV